MADDQDGTTSGVDHVEDSGERRISTGSEGLDDILGGGFDPDRMYLYEGRPGTGKTTIALQFLLEGVRLGERVLYITLSESQRELTLVAKRHGWTLDSIDIFELVPPETSLDPNRELTILHPAEVELSETTKLVFDKVAAFDPTRVVFDSLSELRLLAQNSLRYRRQVLALKHFFTARRRPPRRTGRRPVLERILRASQEDRWSLQTKERRALPITELVAAAAAVPTPCARSAIMSHVYLPSGHARAFPDATHRVFRCCNWRSAVMRFIILALGASELP